MLKILESTKYVYTYRIIIKHRPVFLEILFGDMLKILKSSYSNSNIVIIEHWPVFLELAFIQMLKIL